MLGILLDPRVFLPTEDSDEDGLTNLKEYSLGTEPFYPDSDFDGLSDGDEVNVYATDPLNPDTDEDGIEDGDELKLGIDPNNPISDGVTPDKKRKFKQTYTHEAENTDCAVTEVIIDFEATGYVQRTTSVESVMGIDVLSSDVVGLVGEPFEIDTTSEFDEAKLSFKVDKNKLGDTVFNELIFLWEGVDNHGNQWYSHIY